MQLNYKISAQNNVEIHIKPTNHIRSGKQNLAVSILVFFSVINPATTMMDAYLGNASPIIG
jgi:hypothetical protein